MNKRYNLIIVPFYFHKIYIIKMDIRKIIIETFNEYLNEHLNDKKIAYHGTPHGRFEKFSMKKRGTGADMVSVGDYGKGFYFTPNKDEALKYATNIHKKRKDIVNPIPILYTVELTMVKPFDMRLLSELTKKKLNLMKKYGALNIPDSEYNKMYSDLGLTEEDVDFYLDVQGSIEDNWGDWDIKSRLNNYGYDSIINYTGNEYIVYSPKQIKIINIEEVNI